ncbi:hypothetical protein CHS0354_036985 [Potamilus streckersoni]|uniref:Serine protease n=1 Tax=Potamilus streckersoni TaxID=2493646 RepID=A0AAE0SU14_9BIVA|nr:hypothetical protein CHS0354_036985 [Potamilus streckersoni]
MRCCCLGKKKYEEVKGKTKKPENHENSVRKSQQESEEIDNDTSSSIVTSGSGPRDTTPARNNPTEDSERKKKNIQEELVQRNTKKIEHGNTSDSDDSSRDFPKMVGPESGSKGNQGGVVTCNITGKYIQFGKNSTIKEYNITKKKKDYPSKEGKESRTTSPPYQDTNYSTESSISSEQTYAIPRWPLLHDHQPPPGNLKAQFDRTDAVYNQRLIVNLASSIGIIKSSSTCGTGFRVGPNYVMTAKHVKDGILKAVPVHIAQQQQPINNFLSDTSVYIDFSYEIPNQPVDENCKFFFEPDVVFENEDLDVAILKLRPNANDYPPPLINFSELREMDENLYFIGHSRADIKKMDKFSCVQLTPYQISALHNWRFNNIRPPLGGFDGVEDQHHQLLHCTFEKGAWGAPGVWISPADHMPYVVLMLLRGFPDWYYDEKAPQELKFAIPKHYCVEQGVCMLEIYNAMMQKNPFLCQEIFHYNPAVLSAPTCEND